MLDKEYTYSSTVDTVCLNLSTIDKIQTFVIDTDWAAYGLNSPSEIYKKIPSIIEYIILKYKLPLNSTYVGCSEYTYALLLSNNLIKNANLDTRLFEMRRNLESEYYDTSICGFILNGVDIFESSTWGSFISEEKLKLYHNVFGYEYDSIISSSHSQYSTLLETAENSNFPRKAKIFIITHKTIQHTIELINNLL